MYILTDAQGNIGICNFLVAIYERGNLTIRVSEWLLANANPAMFQLYHGESNLIFNEMMMRVALYYRRIYIVIQYDTYISGIIYGNEMNKKKHEY
jgi:hypothetical protein